MRQYTEAVQCGSTIWQYSAKTEIGAADEALQMEEFEQLRFLGVLARRITCGTMRQYIAAVQ